MRAVVRRTRATSATETCPHVMCWPPDRGRTLLPLSEVALTYGCDRVPRHNRYQLKVRAAHPASRIK